MKLAPATSLVLLALASQLFAQATQPASRAEIDRLILQLSDPQFARRDEATQKLIDAGEAAIPALEVAMKDTDSELAQRAQAVYRVLTKLTPDRRAAVTTRARQAFTRADYPAAAMQQALLARQARATIDECLTLGHDWQLANRWPEAIAGYQRALERVEQVLAGDPETDPPPEPPAGNGFNGLQRNGGRRTGPEALTDFRRRELSSQRAGLILLIGRLQREKLADPRAAVTTFARVVEIVPEFAGDLSALLPPLAHDVADRRARREVPHDIARGLTLLNEFDAMEELAKTQEQIGNTDDALLTLARLATAMIHTRDDGVDDHLAHMTALLLRSPKASALPGADALAKLTPAPAPVPVAVTKPEPFANPQSPFKWTPTNLADFKLGHVNIRDFAPLPDGRWIAVLAAGPRLFITTSRDLVTFDPPRELPHNGLANNVEPALVVDEHGVIWLAWFSNRLSLNPRSSGGYQLWLSSSTDARDWSPPRAIAADTGGWPMGALHWLRTRDGQFRLSWRAAAATAASPADIQALAPLQMFVPQQLWPMDPHVAQDDTGHFHMVLDDRMRGVTYASSTDGRKWSEPLVLIEKNQNGASMETPHLVIEGRRFALIYQLASDTFLRHGSLIDPKTLSAPIQIGGASTPTTATRWARAGDDLVGFAGGVTPWRLRAKVTDLFERH